MKVLTIGSGWADLFEESLSRQLAKIQHVGLGDPAFRLSGVALDGWIGSCPEGGETLRASLLARLNRPTKVASEVQWRLDWFIQGANVLLLDTGMLDTAIGQHCLEVARSLEIPAYGVGVDNRSSPLAACYVKGILYPETADDLVRWVLNGLPRDQKAI